MAGEIIVLVTCPSMKGRDIAHKLVEEKLAACVNIFPRVRSIYSWNGKVEESNEELLMIKTLREFQQKIEDRIKSLHPYDTPEIIYFPIEGGYQPYLDWLRSSVQMQESMTGLPTSALKEKVEVGGAPVD